MEWSSFFGAFAGGAVGVLIFLGSFIMFDEINRRKQLKVAPPKIMGFNDILESHFEQYVVQHFDVLFPNWKIYATNVQTDSSIANVKPTGIRYRTEAGEIDILCLDPEDNFIVIELKRNKAPDKVVAQTDRYITWVERTLAQPNQKVRGLIIARSFDKHLAYILDKRNTINLWTYNWYLEFDKNAVAKVNVIESK